LSDRLAVLKDRAGYGRTWLCDFLDLGESVLSSCTVGDKLEFDKYDNDASVLGLIDVLVVLDSD
jgi:hypothetical protein